VDTARSLGATAQLSNQESTQKVAQLPEDPLAEEITKLLNEVNHRCAKQHLDPEAQEALAESIDLLNTIALTDVLWLKDMQIVNAIHVSINALYSSPPNTDMASAIHRDLKERLQRASTARQTLYRSFRWSMMSTPTAAVVLGLFALLCFLSVVFWRASTAFTPQSVSKFLEIEPTALLLIAVVGALGSIVSIMIRIRTFTFGGNIPDAWPFFFFGLFKPIVGALFALFIVSALQAALIPAFQLPHDSGKSAWFFVTVAFLAGFSERFAGDIVTSMEASSESKPTQVPPTEKM
jgi:hypothetical protein